MIQLLPPRYVLKEELGRGAMGVVYLAHDTRLDRKVAVKALLPEWSDRERTTRLRHEARLLAAMTDPHIAALHEVEEQDGSFFLILEYVPGKTLASRLAESRMPLAEILDVFGQLAEGIEAAHRRGILHRDLKPSNVALTPDGVVKILDFGLGKLTEFRADGHDPADPSNFSIEGTAVGAVLGTHGYMSPEQLRGRDVDRRTDVWGFGCLLFEALAGRKAFRGETTADTIARVLDHEPDWSALPSQLPPPLVDLVKRCLEKDPRYRLRDMGEAWVVLDRLSRGGELGSAARGRNLLAKPAWWWLVAGGVLGTAVTLPLAMRQRDAPSGVRPWFDLHLDPAIANSYTTALAISPDGSQMVYTASDSTYMRRMDNLRLRALPLPPGTRNIFFSPDGRSLGFMSSHLRLQRLTLADGKITTICNSNETRGAAWSPSDSIVFTRSFTSGLDIVSMHGGAPLALTSLDSARGEVTHRWPEVLPGGRAVIFTVRRREHLTYSEADIEVVELETRRRKTLVEGGAQARFAPPASLVFVRNSMLYALPFDLDRLEVTGTPTPLDVRVETNAPTGASLFAIGREGTLVFVPDSDANKGFALPVWLDRSGKVAKTLHTRFRCENPVPSPDGTRLAVTFVDAQNDVGAIDLQTDRTTRLTFDPAEDVYPIWTRDGRSITFTSSRNGSLNLYCRPADGSGVDSRLTVSSHQQGPCDWAPDDSILVFTDEDPVTRSDLWTLDRHAGVTKPLVRTPAEEREARISPDGRWMAYESNESGRPEIYVIGFLGEEGRWQVSHGGGRLPRWSPRGDELFYIGDRFMVAVRLEVGESFGIGAETQLFELPQPDLDFAVAPDGKSFVALSSESGPDHIVVATSWSLHVATQP